jgi:hypothetical protein
MNLSPDFGQLLKILVGTERLYHMLVSKQTIK